MIKVATPAMREENKKPMRWDTRAVKKANKATIAAMVWRMSALEMLCTDVAVALLKVVLSILDTMRAMS